MNTKLRKVALASFETAVRQALEIYEAEVNASGVQPRTRTTYLTHARNFVRWIEGDFKPGATLGSD